LGKQRAVTSYTRDKEEVLRRLRKMEGQVRGLQQMIEEDRYCLDVVQQINAVTAAARKVAVIVLENHLLGCVSAAVTPDDSKAAMQEIATVLDKALHS
jgi:DNA-binding FrmR family transcriptional regulator